MNKAFLAALLLALAPSAADCEEIAFKIGLSEAKPKLAEPFTLKFEISCPAGYEVKPDTPSFRNDVFEVTRIKKLKAGPAAGAVKTEVFELEVSAFSIGVSTFPATDWLLITGAETRKASSPAFTVDVQPLFDSKKEEEQGIRPIYPPYKFPPWLWITLGVLAAAAAAYFLRKWLKNRSAAGLAAAAAAADARTPYQKASDALDKLLGSGLWEEGKIKEFYSGLSDIFRTYLFAEFGIAAELMTTGAITRDLKKTGADIKTVIKTREFLESADLVKFAKFRPGEGDRDATVKALREMLTVFAAQKHAAEAAAAAKAQAAKDLARI